MTWTLPLMLGVAHAEFPSREPMVASLPADVPTSRTTPRGLTAARGAKLICGCGAAFTYGSVPKYCPSCRARLTPKAGA